MITNGRYKRILDRMPQGVFVFDDKLRVKFTNAAFRRSFSEGVKSQGTLAQAVGCPEEGKCGEGAYCAQCAFLRVMKNALSKGKPALIAVQSSPKDTMSVQMPSSLAIS